MLLLSDLLGSAVHGPDGVVVGRLVDVVVEVGEEHPPLRRLMVGRHRRIRAAVSWDVVVAFERDDIRISTTRGDATGSPEPAALGERDLLLSRDVLDTQVIDVAGKRLARVSDALLDRVDREVRVVGVEVGAAGLWRRLGMAPVGRACARSVRGLD